jgi:hypothetical protein
MQNTSIHVLGRGFLVFLVNDEIRYNYLLPLNGSPFALDA